MKQLSCINQSLELTESFEIYDRHRGSDRVLDTRNSAIREWDLNRELHEEGLHQLLGERVVATAFGL